MRSLLKLFAYLLLVLVLIAAAAVGYVFVSTSQRMARTYDVTPPPLDVPVNDAEALERGRFLVHRVSLCVECHGEDLGGKALAEVPKSVVWGSNLTRGRGGLGATYSDADFRLGFNACQTTLAAIATLVEARIVAAAAD